jgi:hydroxymethylpyrimidine/phosphomethylpyrimidine kinase
MLTRPYVLSIAGFDPSSGAGITADMKTYEQLSVYGLGVCSAITYQNESEFEGVEWLPVDSILRQLSILFTKYDIAFAKVGLIENLDILCQLITWLKAKNVKVVWDPILQTSSGYALHNNWDSKTLQLVLSDVYLLTPNLPEFKFLCAQVGVQSVTELMTDVHLNAMLLKGGHGNGSECCDILYYGGFEFVMEGKRMEGAFKHGTGCVLSSAIVSRLARGFSLPKSCEKAKRYVEMFIASNQTLLGYHS